MVPVQLFWRSAVSFYADPVTNCLSGTLVGKAIAYGTCGQWLTVHKLLVVLKSLCCECPINSQEIYCCTREANCINYLEWVCGVCRAAEGRAWDGGEPGESLQLRVPGLPLAPRGGSLHTDGGRQGGIHLSLPHCQPTDVLPRYPTPLLQQNVIKPNTTGTVL